MAPAGVGAELAAVLSRTEAAKVSRLSRRFLSFSPGIVGQRVNKTSAILPCSINEKHEYELTVFLLSLDILQTSLLGVPSHRFLFARYTGVAVARGFHPTRMNSWHRSALAFRVHCSYSIVIDLLCGPRSWASESMEQDVVKLRMADESHMR